MLLFSSSFLSDPPTFILFGNTSGGPPTTYIWTRNGQVITTNASYKVTLLVNQGAGAHFVHSLYRSTLTVTGRLPGVYQYSVTNRATSGMVTDQINIEGIILFYYNLFFNHLNTGEPPSHLTTEQTGAETVRINWTAPSPPPSLGYKITVDSESNNVSSSPHILTTTTLGVHSVQLQSYSSHYPSEVVGPVNFTVRG